MKKKIAVLTTGWSIDYVNLVLEGVRSVAELNNADVHTFVCYTFTDQRKQTNYTGYNIFSLIDYSKYDGVIILGNIFDNSERLEIERKRILESGVPAISLLKELKGLDFIDCDETEGYIKLLQHTRDAHHLTNYAYIGGPDNDIQSQLRYETFKKFLSINNLELKKEQVFLGGDYTSNFAAHTAVKIFNDLETLPEIIVCINDFTAISVIAEANKLGIKIPEQVKVIGFDNISSAGAVNPSISTCDGRSRTLGYIAAKTVLQKKRGDISVTKQIIPSRMLLRQSCGCNKCESKKQKNYVIERLKTVDDFEILASQVRHFEDFFLVHDEPMQLISDLAHFFEQRHYFEGRSFAVMLKKSFLESFVSGNFDRSENAEFGDSMMSSVLICDDKLYPQSEIKTADLIPSQLESENSNLFIFFPIVSLQSIYGYLICKNNTKMLESKRAYTWLKNLANNFNNLEQRLIYKLTSEKYLYLSTQDALSGVLNRNGYETFAYKLFDDNKRNNKSTSIIFVDINSMKPINDIYGHLQGDFAVKTVASAITDVKPAGWLAIRYGGDEFVVIGSTDSMTGEEFCEKFNEHLSSLTDKMKLPYKLTASTGNKDFSPDFNATLDEAVAQVDKMMYINKKMYHLEKKL